jgi:hypothetical protein
MSLSPSAAAPLESSVLYKDAQSLLSLLDERSNESSLNAARKHRLLLPLSCAAEPAQSPEWQSARAEAMMRNTFLAEQAALLIAAFRSQGLRPLSIKGASLAIAVYDGLMRREFCDIDLFFDRSQISEAIAVARTRGFQLKRQLNLRQFRSELSTQHAFTLIHHESNIELDLHWQFAEQQFALPSAAPEMFSRTQFCRYGSHELEILSHRDALRLALISGIKDRWRSLRLLLDCKLLLERCSENEIAAERQYFHESGVGPAVEGALSLLTDVFPELANRLSPILNTGVKEIIRKNIGASLDEAACYRYDLNLRHGLKSKARYCWGRLTVVHDRDWELDLPYWAFWLHWVQKPTGTLLRGMRSQLKR